MPEAVAVCVLASIPPKAREAIERARRGDLSGAIICATDAVLATPDDAGLRMFVGSLHLRQQDPDRAIPHFLQATKLLPEDPLPKLELSRVLIDVDRLDEAEALIGETRLAQPAANALLRLRALLLHRRGEHDASRALYEAIVTSDPRDFESWANLGACLLALGRAAESASAFAEALALRPTHLAFRIKLVEAQVAAGHAEIGLDAARAAANAAPDDPLALIAVARFEDLLGRPDQAEVALQQALTLDPVCSPALLTLGDLLERANRIDALEAVLSRADAAEIPSWQTVILRARLLYRQNKLHDALATATAARTSIDGGSRAELIGRISDRLGDFGGAFAAFTEMNRLTAAEVADSRSAAALYRAGIHELAQVTTPQWYARWTPASPLSERPAPAFLFGFPRSGTTLLDTMLMGHPDTVVLEEAPILETIAQRAGPADGLSALDDAAIEALRQRYFAAVDAITPDAAGRLVIDKLPLGSINTLFAHRIFPDARFIFVERHPLDVVLSCFMTRFQPTAAGVNFLDLHDAALLYDMVLNYWQQCRDVLPLAVHHVRYETMIDDAQGELRPLAAFLGLDWHSGLLDHRRTAEERRFIATPSYAQVAEPLYNRARGRWRHYREQIAPVLTLLTPWAERMGYTV